MTFRDALSVEAAKIIADPTDLIQYAKTLTDKIETVVVTASPESPYGAGDDYWITYSTADGQQGEGSSTPVSHALHGGEMSSGDRLVILKHNAIDVHHGLVENTYLLEDANKNIVHDNHGNTVEVTNYLTDDGHIVGLANVYRASLMGPDGTAADMAVFDTRAAMNQFLQDKWAAGQNNWTENYGLSDHINDETVMYADAANPGWSGSISLKFGDGNGASTSVLIPAGSWVDVIYWHEYDHAHFGVGSTPADEYNAYLYGLHQTGLI